MYFYLHLLIFFHDRGVPNIKKLAPYAEVKQILVEYWDLLVRQDLSSEVSRPFCKPVLCDQHPLDDGEEKLLESLSLCLRRTKRWKKEQITSFNCQQLINMLRDILCLDSGGNPSRVFDFTITSRQARKILEGMFGKRISVKNDSIAEIERTK